MNIRCFSFLVAASLALAAVAVSGELSPEGFSVRMQVDLAAVKTNEDLLSVGPARIGLRLAGGDKALLQYDRAAGNYLNFPLKDGS